MNRVSIICIRDSDEGNIHVIDVNPGSIATSAEIDIIDFDRGSQGINQGYAAHVASELLGLPEWAKNCREAAMGELTMCCGITSIEHYDRMAWGFVWDDDRYTNDKDRKTVARALEQVLEPADQ